jgi:CubicO group peptidase (beta-lactamase class C family)
MQNGDINDSIFGNPAKRWTMDEILWLAKAPNFAPGTNWSYSNTNYIVAGIIIREVTGKSVEQAMHELILQPNGLNHSFFYGEPTTDSIAHPWTVVLNNAQLTDLTTTPYTGNLFSLASSAGAMITTAEDNVMFWHKLISGQILSPASMIEMRTMVQLNSTVSYGLGIFKNKYASNGRSYFSHGGTFFGFINENMVEENSGITIAVLTNQDYFNNDFLSDLVMPALHKVVLQMHVGIAEAAYNNPAVKLYPNPAIGIINLDAEQYGEGTSLTLYDLNGKEQILGTAGNGPSSFSVAHLPAGLYVAVVKDANGQTLNTQKMLLQK